MPSQQPPQYTRTGVIAKLAKWHGGHNASDNSWGRLASQVDPYDDEAVAEYFHKSITADAQKPLLAEITKLKVQLFDLQNAAPEPLTPDQHARLLWVIHHYELQHGTKPTTPVERLTATGLSKEAAEVAVGMIHDSINQGHCMGMDEGIANDETREKHPWRKELEKFFGYVDPDDGIPMGARVLLRRGGHDDPPNCVPKSIGHYRDVKATFLRAEGSHVVVCSLEQDDPYAAADYCTRKGDTGGWSKSIMRLDPEP